MVAPLLLAAALAGQPNPVRILFIGNSLTYANDLPAQVCAMAASAGRRAVCESVANPDFGLEEHWHEGTARRVIARGWDVVVLQQDHPRYPSRADCSLPTRAASHPFHRQQPDLRQRSAGHGLRHGAIHGTAGHL